MAEDRLSQIWQSFAKSTTRYLTDKNIDNIPRPDFKDRDLEQGGNLYTGDRPGNDSLDMAFAGLEIPEGGLPGQIGEPARAAMSALRERLSPQAANAEGQRPKREAQGQYPEHKTAYPAENTDPNARTGRAGEPALHTQSGPTMGAGFPDDDTPENQLIDDLKATAMLTTRRETNYLSYAIEQNLLTSEKKKRRGFLSFFRKKGL